MLDGLCNIADQLCVLVVGVGKAILPGMCAPLVDLYGSCVYAITGAIRGAPNPSWKGAAVAGAIGIGGLYASGYIGTQPPQNQQSLLGSPAAPADSTATTSTATTPPPPVTTSLPGWNA